MNSFTITRGRFFHGILAKFLVSRLAWYMLVFIMAADVACEKDTRGVGVLFSHSLNKARWKGTPSTAVHKDVHRIKPIHGPPLVIG